MTAQDYRLRTTTAATQGAAAIMALIAVIALGLMGFAMGYAKADRAPLAARARDASIPGVAAARVSMVTPGEMMLAAAEPAPAAPRPRAPTVVAPSPIVSAPAIEPTETVADPQAEPRTVSEPAQAPIA